jgi:hypothetical protein
MNSLELINQQITDLEKRYKNIKGTECQVYCRPVGYYAPISSFNPGKLEEFNERKNFNLERINK